MNTDKKTVALKYTNRVYKPLSQSFEFYKEDEDEEEEELTYSLDQIKQCNGEWNKAVRRCSAVTRNQNENIEAMRSAKEKSRKGTWDMTDIDDFFKKNGKCPKLLEFEFKPSTKGPELYTDKKGRQAEKWIWNHRTIPTTNGITRFTSSSGKSFDTGSLSKFLIRISQTKNPEEYARSRHIMRLNGTMTVNVEDNNPLPLDRRLLLKQQVCLLLCHSS